MEVLTVLVLLVVVWGVYNAWTWLREKEVLSRLVDKSVLITGCDTGFGNLLARRLDQLGLRVFAGCLTEAGVAELRQSCSERLQPIQMDVTRSDSVQQAFLAVKNSVGSKGLWGLVNNAGIFGPLGSVEWSSIADYQAVLNVNLLGMINVTKTFLPLLKKSRGRVVNVASGAGRVAVPFQGPYSVSKFAVEGFSDVLRRGMRCFGVTVHIVEPGKFSTGITAQESIRRNMYGTFETQSPETKMEYGLDYVDEMHKGFNEDAGGDPNLVTMAMEHALCAAHPKSRYVVGQGTRLVWIPISWLPTDLGDYVIRVMIPWMAPVPAACKGEK
uniref:Microsomal retinol dehydrogenase n=1 Tax=Branchiostoma lanceolatum TaxID=7740 RepID=Q9GQA8_BRALA|nr:microsomal retinol dehydrogenase [Branchiostoma lanceolatum]